MSRIHAAAMAGAACIALSAGSAFGQVASAADQAQPADSEEEIVVTAARRGDQSLQSTPLAIQAFSGEELSRLGIHDTSDLLAAVPGAAPAEQVGTVIRTVTIRGVGGTSGIGDSPVGYYIDDVPFSIPNSPLAPPLRFLDIERIEVLRGPQGTLYGQGSAGGTIIYHTRDPNLTDFEAATETTVSATEEAGGLNYGVSGAISFPLIPGELALRVSGGYDERAGYVDIYDGLPTSPPREEDANDITNRDIRAVLLWEPTNALRVRAQVAHWEPQQDYSQSISSVEPPQHYFMSGVRGYEEGDFDLYGVSVEYDVGFASISSATSYLDAEYSYLTGQDFGFLGSGSLFNGYGAHSFSQELQIRSNDDQPLHWLIGGFYQSAASRFDFDANLTAITIAGYTTTTTDNYSVFGEVSYDLFGGQLVPLVGVRYYSDDREYVSDSPLSGGYAAGGDSPEKVTWRVNLSYHPSRDITAFATVSTGFRSGITQTPFQVFVLNLSGIPGEEALNPDSLTNYEIGLKTRVADGTLQFGVNLYRIDFEDLQLGFAPSGVAAFANAGSGSTTGVDLEAQWNTPIEGLSLSAVANFNDSEFGDVDPVIAATVPGVQEGERLTNTTKYNYRFDADYEGSFNENMRWFWNASASSASSRVMAGDGYVVPGHSLYGGSLGLRGDTWEIALFGENLGDERGPTFVRNGTTLFPVVVGPYPRTFGLRLRANFD